MSTSRRYKPSQQHLFELELLRALTTAVTPQPISILRTGRQNLTTLSHQKMGQMLKKFEKHGLVVIHGGRPQTYELTKGARKMLDENMSTGLDMAIFDLLNGSTIASSPDYQNEVADAVAYCGGFRNEGVYDGDF